MNKENINWVDIDGVSEKQEVKFTPLNENVMKTKTNMKMHLIEHALLNECIKVYGTHKTVSESVLKNQVNNGLFDAGEWKSFENHARMIAQLLGASVDEVNKLIAKIKTVFQKLGGNEENLDQGVSQFSKIANIFDSSSEQSPLYGLEPPLKIQQVFDSLYNSSDDGNEFIDFCKYIAGISKGKFMNVIQNGKTLKDVLYAAAASQKPPLNADKICNAFSQITQMDRFNNHGNQIGKGEIAIALFFSDTRMSRDQGDIELIKGRSNGTEKYEIKIHGAGITSRLDAKTFPPGMFGKSGNWRKFKEIQPDAKAEKKVIETIVKNEIEADDWNRIRNELLENNGWSSFPDKQRSLNFRILFSAAWADYSKNFKSLIALNTRNKNFSINSPLFTNPPLQLKRVEGGNWYTSGVDLLGSLPHNCNIVFQTIGGSSQTVFKIEFLAEK